MLPPLVFRAIDLERDASSCIEFRADSYVCGDGGARRFWATAGANGQVYLARLATYMEALPGSCVHAWLDQQIIGQVEMIRDPEMIVMRKALWLEAGPRVAGR